MTPREIAERLAQDAESIASMLLPNGKREGHEWRAGSVDGDAGKSLGVHLTGSKAGRWQDFADPAGKGGDLLDLWAATRGVTLAEAIAQTKAHLGIRDPQFHPMPAQHFCRPEKPKCSTAKTGSPVFEYLAGRGLAAETLAAYRIAERGREIVFPSLHDGELVAVKYLGIDRPDGKKVIRVAKDCEPALFGWQAIPDTARVVTITEGELDALSAFQMGFPALSVPFGGGGGAKQQWIEHEFERLERFDTIYLALDNDPPGQQATAEIVERLGAHRCMVVDIPAPHKDVNDLLQADWTTDQLRALFEQAKTLDPTELRSAALYADDVVREFYPTNGSEPGFSTPWPKLHDRLALRPGEVSILAGANGSGKSELGGHVLLGGMEQGERACVASLEFKAVKWLKRLTRQAAASREPTQEHIHAVHRWYGGKLWVFDVTGTAKTGRILEVFAYAARRYGIRFFIIDNLAKCGLGEDDYNGQKHFIDALTDFAKIHDAHVLLVHHTRKGESEDKPQGKFDIKGSGGITDMADTVLVLWRNKPKETALRQAEARRQTPDRETLEKFDAVLQCHKQRNGEEEPGAALWFDLESHQFIERQGDAPRIYVPRPVAPILQDRKAAAAAADSEVTL